MIKLTQAHYEAKINDCIRKAPFESGVEFLVFNLLDEIVDENILSVIDINRCPKNADARLCTKAGIPDIAIVSKDFVFQNPAEGKVYGFIEVKAAGLAVRETVQILGQCSKAPHYIATNGINWLYYHNGVQQWKLNICTKQIPYSAAPLQIDKDKYKDLVQKLTDIVWHE